MTARSGQLLVLPLLIPTTARSDRPRDRGLDSGGAPARDCGYLALSMLFRLEGLALDDGALDRALPAPTPEGYSMRELRDVPVDTVFLGSCTNSRIEDLRVAAGVLDGRHVRSGLRALVVPGSHKVKAQAEAEGLDKVFTAAGFDWREPGCSMCLAMNPDKLSPGERCASTSNRNFEGRQGFKGRTHLVSPQMAAAAAIAGHFVDIRDLT